MTTSHIPTIALAFTLVVLGAGCGDASPPSELRAGHPTMGGSADVPATTTDSAQATPEAPAAGASSTGTPGPGAAAPAPSSTAPDFFAGAPAYANVAGRATQVGAHPSNGTAQGAACFTCHGSSAPAMVMGGTVYADAAGTTPAANAQVVLKVGAGFVSANTNANGNFYVFGSAFAGTASVGVRNGTASHAMAGGITSGDCNSCHNGTTTSRIHLP